LKVLLDEKKELMNTLSKYEPAKKPDDPRPHLWTPPIVNFDRKKRHRRTAGEIERHYKCPILSCLKSYG
jgi:hypothetical protein